MGHRILRSGPLGLSPVEAVMGGSELEAGGSKVPARGDALRTLLEGCKEGSDDKMTPPLAPPLGQGFNDWWETVSLSCPPHPTPSKTPERWILLFPLLLQVRGLRLRALVPPSQAPVRKWWKGHQT